MTNEKYNTKFKEHIIHRLEKEYGYSKETSMHTYQMYDSVARIARLRAKTEHGFSKKHNQIITEEEYHLLIEYADSILPSLEK